MLPYKYFVLTALFFFVVNNLMGFIKNRFIESDEIGNDLLTKVRLSLIPILLFLVFGCIANAELGDALFSTNGEFNLFVGAILFSTVLCGIFLLATLCFSFDILFTSHEKESVETAE